MTLLPDEHALKTYVDTVVVVPTDADPMNKYRAEMAKAKRMILDGVRDHVVCHVARKRTAKDMWDALDTLYHGIFPTMKDVLRGEPEIFLYAEGRTCGSVPHETEGDP